jgi:ATP-dependent DNA ligase
MDEERLLKWKPPYIVQPKLDGDRMRAILGDSYIEGYTQLLSSEENKMATALPHIAEYLSNLTTRFPELRSLELDGEAYAHGMPHELIHGITSRRTNPHNQLEDLEYWVFDVVENLPMHKRLDMLLNLNEIFHQVPGPCHVVPFKVAESLDEIMKIYDGFLNKGYEGIIVRHIDAYYERRRSPHIMKFKPKKEDMYVIVGYQEEISIHGIPKGTLGAIRCRSNEGEEEFSVGTGFTNDQRRELWSRRLELPGKVIRVAYQHLTPGRKVPRFPVFCEVIWGLSDIDYSTRSLPYDFT